MALTTALTPLVRQDMTSPLTPCTNLDRMAFGLYLITALTLLVTRPCIDLLYSIVRVVRLIKRAWTLVVPALVSVPIPVTIGTLVLPTLTPLSIPPSPRVVGLTSEERKGVSIPNTTVSPVLVLPKVV